MPEYKHIKYRAKLSPDRAKVIVHITEQTHRCSRFGNHLTDFRISDFRLISSMIPDSHFCGPDVVFMRGSDRSQDDLEISMPLEKYAKFKEAVLAYNSYFSGKEV